MKDFSLIVVGRCLATVACIAVAGALALNGKDGWGWFLFIGMILAPSMSGEDE